MLEINKVHCGDVRDLSDKLDENSINTIITSPPYWALRHYGIPPSSWDGDPICDHEFVPYEHKVEMYDNDKRAHWQNEGVSRQSAPEVWKKIDLGYGFCKKCGAWEGTLGLEPDFKLYVKHLCDIFGKLKRPLRDDGTLWVNIGDTYYTKSGSGFHFDKVRGHPEGKSNIHMANAIRGMGLLPTKCLVLAPFRFAIEMCNRGWTCRNVIIWQKNNVIPTSANDRFTVDFEYFFLFTQNRKYYFKQQLEPYQTPKEQQYRPNAYPDKAINKGKESKSGQGIHDGKRKREDFFKAGGRNKRTVWKYDSIEQESLYRQGMHKNRGSGLVEKRDLPTQKNFVEKLREVLTIEEIVGITDLLESTVSHWFRRDKSGFSYPSKKDWELVNAFYPDLFPELTDVYYETDSIGKSNQGRNKRTVWRINTRPSKEAHFAVFPPELVRIPIDAGCPEFMCKECGKPRIPIFKKGKLISKRKPEKGKMAQNKDVLGNKSLRDGYEEHERYLTYTDCGCKAGFKPGVVLDPFAGTNTTGRVARSLKRDWIAFDASEEYCKIAERLVLKEIEWEKEDSGDDLGDMMLI